jgi:hypothetical protein
MAHQLGAEDEAVSGLMVDLATTFNHPTPSAHSEQHEDYYDMLEEINMG